MCSLLYAIQQSFSPNLPPSPKKELSVFEKELYFLLFWPQMIQFDFGRMRFVVAPYSSRNYGGRLLDRGSIEINTGVFPGKMCSDRRKNHACGEL